METKDRKNRTRSSEKQSVKDRMNQWVSKSPKLEKFVDNTSFYIKNPDKFTEKVNEIYNRATGGQGNHPLSEFSGKIKSLYRMVKMAWEGEYDGIPKGNILLGFGAFVYLVSPVDIVPDFLPFVGFMDDAALMLWLIKKASDEVDKFEKWEQSHGMTTVNPTY